MEKIYGEEYKGDSPCVADCRKMQSVYRVEIGEGICHILIDMANCIDDRENIVANALVLGHDLFVFVVG